VRCSKEKNFYHNKLFWQSFAFRPTCRTCSWVLATALPDMSNDVPDFDELASFVMFILNPPPLWTPHQLHSHVLHLITYAPISEFYYNVRQLPQLTGLITDPDAQQRFIGLTRRFRPLCSMVVIRFNERGQFSGSASVDFSEAFYLITNSLTSPIHQHFAEVSRFAYELMCDGHLLDPRAEIGQFDLFLVQPNTVRVIAHFQFQSSDFDEFQVGDSVIGHNAVDPELQPDF